MTEVWFLIERERSYGATQETGPLPGLEYLALVGFTLDPDEALKFASMDEADGYVRHTGMWDYGWRAVEHGWYPRPADTKEEAT